MTEPGLDVICGPMWAEKTKELIRRMRAFEEASERVACFKPSIDTRGQKNRIETHCGTMSYPCTEVCNPWMILGNAISKEATVVGIDEAQFFQGTYYSFLQAVRRLIARHGVRVVIAGLDMDYKGETFGPMGDLLACADSITKLRALCPCGKEATMTVRLPEYGKEQVVVGGDTVYRPRCRSCWAKEMKTRPGFMQDEGRWP